MSSYLTDIAAAIRKAPTGGEWLADSAENEDRLDALVADAADSAAAGEMYEACDIIEQIRRMEIEHGDCPTYRAIIAAIQPLVVEWVADLGEFAFADRLETVADDRVADEAEGTARECGLRNLGQETWDMATELRVSALLDWAAGRDDDELAKYGIRVVQDAEATHLVCRDGRYHSSYHGSWGCGGHIDDSDAPDCIRPPQACKPMRAYVVTAENSGGGYVTMPGENSPETSENIDDAEEFLASSESEALDAFAKSYGIEIRYRDDASITTPDLLIYCAEPK